MKVSGDYNASILGAYNAMGGPSSASSSSDPVWSAMRNSVQSQTQNFRDLNNALQTGDLPGAQTAYAAAGKTIQNTAASYNGASLVDPDSEAGQSFQALGAALNSGDLAEAKSSFAAFKQNLKTGPVKSTAAAEPTSLPSDAVEASNSSLLDVFA